MISLMVPWAAQKRLPLPHMSKNKSALLMEKYFFTRDTHFEDYLDSQEDKKLPGPHCVQNTYGW